VLGFLSGVRNNLVGQTLGAYVCWLSSCCAVDIPGKATTVYARNAPRIPEVLCSQELQLGAGTKENDELECLPRMHLRVSHKERKDLRAW
jgi:hypothetical protein